MQNARVHRIEYVFASFSLGANARVQCGDRDILACHRDLCILAGSSPESRHKRAFGSIGALKGVRRPREFGI